MARRVKAFLTSTRCATVRSSSSEVATVVVSECLLNDMRLTWVLIERVYVQVARARADIQMVAYETVSRHICWVATRTLDSDRLCTFLKAFNNGADSERRHIAERPARGWKPKQVTRSRTRFSRDSPTPNLH